jgi:NTP pyrophosphatase (non-canonical NTP hydrolase)
MIKWISQFQKLMKERYGEKDKKRGPYFLITVLVSEVGELADAIKKNDINRIQEELADLIFCATSISNFFNINLNEIIESKYVKQKSEQVSRKWSEPVNEWINPTINDEKEN